MSILSSDVGQSVCSLMFEELLVICTKAVQFCAANEIIVLNVCRVICCL